ncbi:MAG: T9SS type A sorting domain-containing protein [Cyclobacteriaceae bacterium]
MMKIYIRVYLVALVVCSSLGWLQAQPAIYGTTPFGGGNGIGTLFKTDTDGANHQTIFDFKSIGSAPSGLLLEVSPGKFYGTTTKYAGTTAGVIFEYDVANSLYTEKFNFGGEDGYGPYGGLIKANNGKLYGLTLSGGANLVGVLFEYDYVNNVYTKKIDMSLTIGAYPISSLYEASNGLLYGLASGGGASSKGALFEYNTITNVFTKKIDFNGAGNGQSPQGSLMEVNGKLYGTTYSGGAQNGGTFFEYDISSGVLTKKQDLTNTNPLGTPLLASNGKIYGSTTYGGTNLSGTIYEYNPGTSTYTVKANIDDVGLNYGVGVLVEVSPGKLLGITTGGGTSGYGGVFEYDIATSILTKRFDFSSALGHASLNSSSFAIAGDGKLYGQLPSGGNADAGVLYTYEPATITYTKLFDFDLDDRVFGPRDFVETSSNRLFGVSSTGGNNSQGTLFEYDFVTQQALKKVDFGSALTGMQPYLLLEGSDGKLYGRSFRGGATDRGVVFEYDMDSETVTKRLDLSSSIGQRGGGMIEVSGILYLFCESGATSNSGSLIGLDLSTNLTTTINHMASIGAFSTQGSPLLASNGKLYGTSSRGGTTDQGTLFEYNISTDVLTKKHDFAVATGAKSYSTLVEGATNKLYGLTSEGGANGLGVVFEYDINTDTYTDKFDFDGLTMGGIPTGSLIKSSNGMLYGITSTGGANGFGTYFEYNPATNTIAVKHDLTKKSTEVEKAASLMEVCPKPVHANISNIIQCPGSSLSIDLNSPNTDTYVWKKDGNVMSGQTNGSLSFSSLTEDHAGQYTVEMTNSCGTSFVSFAIDVNSVTNLVTIVNVTCNGNANGSIEIATTSGDDPYEYSIDGINFNAANSFTGLSGGDYTITTKDVNGCLYTNLITVVEPAVLNVTASNTATGASLVATGGTAPYTYAMDGSTFQSDATFALSNGAYSFTAKDANDCTAEVIGNTVVTALEDESIGSGFFYPNPATSKINISGDKDIHWIRIVDLSGKVIVSENVDGIINPSLNVTQFPRGVYFLLITDGNGRVSKYKMMKE